MFKALINLHSYTLLKSDSLTNLCSDFPEILSFIAIIQEFENNVCRERIQFIIVFEKNN
jgi:hypothetical protein